MKSLLKDTQVVLAANPSTSSASSDVASKVIDMNGFDSCTFINTIGATSTVVTMVAQMSASTSDADFAAMTNTTVGPTTVGNGVLVIDIHKPTKRYLRTVLTSTGASNLSGGTVAILYNARSNPTTNATSDVIDSTSVVST